MQRVSLVVVVVIAGACANANRNQNETIASTQPHSQAAAALERGDVGTVQLVLDPGVAGIPTLTDAARRYGCTVDADYMDGADTLVARCPDGHFGAVQEGRQLTLLCASMNEHQCSDYVLRMLDP